MHTARSMLVSRSVAPQRLPEARAFPPHAREAPKSAAFTSYQTSGTKVRNMAHRAVRNLLAAAVACVVSVLCGGGTAMAAPFLYSLSYTGGVKIFDTQTQTFVPNSIVVPPSAVGFALSPSGDRVYLSGGSTIDVIETSNNTQMATISFSSTVPACQVSDDQRISVRPQNDKLYFVCTTGANVFSLYPVPISTYLPQPPIVINAPGRAIGTAINSAGTRLWIARRSADVLAVDLVTNATAVIPGVADPNGLGDIAYDPILNRVYVPTANGVVPIDASNDAVLSTIGSGLVRSVAPSPDGSRVYALSPSFGITAFTAGGALIGSVTGLSGTSLLRFAIAVSPVDGKIYLLIGDSCAGTGSVQVIDPVTLVAGAPIPVPGIYCEPRAAGKLIIGVTASGVASIPTLSTWALIMLAAMLALVGLVGTRTRAARTRPR